MRTVGEDLRAAEGYLEELARMETDPHRDAPGPRTGCLCRRCIIQRLARRLHDLAVLTESGGRDDK